MNRKWIYGLALLLAIAAVVAIRAFRGTDPISKVEKITPAVSSFWTCPMHPTVHKDGPGACPVCGMNLVERSGVADEPAQRAKTSGDVTLSASKEILANVATSPAERRSLSLVINATGTIAYAEPLFRRVSARFPGRVEKLFATFEGQSIRKGEPVALLYSPEAISAQQEYLIALQVSGDTSLLEQSRQKLLRWGFSAGQIAELAAARVPNEVVAVASPLSGVVIRKSVDQGQYVGTGDPIADIADLSVVWMNGEVYEPDLRWTTSGAQVSVSTDAWPGRTFNGRVSFVSPSLDPSTRTVGFRAELSNADGALKRDMFVKAALQVSLPPSIVVPSSALLSSGGGQIVWVRVAEGRYARRGVHAGTAAGGFVQIISGLDEGETVVTSGGYLIDSESQLQ